MVAVSLDCPFLIALRYFPTLVVIDTDCTGSFNSNYHTITTTKAPRCCADRAYYFYFCFVLFVLFSIAFFCYTLKSAFIENISETMCIIRDTTSETRCLINFHHDWDQVLKKWHAKWYKVLNILTPYQKTKTLTKVMSTTRYCMNETTNEIKWSIYNTLSEIRRIIYSAINETILPEMISIITSTTRKV
jgi:hypothetical protein